MKLFPALKNIMPYVVYGATMTDLECLLFILRLHMYNIPPVQGSSYLCHKVSAIGKSSSV